MKGFWGKAIAMLEDMVERGMIRGNLNKMIEIADNLNEIKTVIEN